MINKRSVIFQSYKFSYPLLPHMIDIYYYYLSNSKLLIVQLFASLN